MTTLLALLAILAAFCAASFLFVLVAMCRIASGESDVNGDPERDSGAHGDDISDLPGSWDHGSGDTESRPNLEYARRMNREAMRRNLNP